MDIQKIYASNNNLYQKKKMDKVNIKPQDKEDNSSFKKMLQDALKKY